jgi:hypothetical protein
MKQGRTEKAVFAKLSAEKVELKEKKIELSNLSLLKDVAKDSIRLNRVMLEHNGELVNKFKELSSSVRASEQIVNDFNRMKADLESAAKELGVDVSGDIKQLSSPIMEVEQTIRDMKKRWGVK